MSKRQITIKPTCLREISSFPIERSALLWEKINQLVIDPTPDGKSKKRVKCAEGLFRLRVADHRVFYRYGDDWVSLLGVRRRSEDTYEGVPEGEATAALPPDEEEDLDDLIGEKPPKAFTLEPVVQGRRLPFPITSEWLSQRGVPESLHPALLACRSEEELLAARVPADLLLRVIEAVFPPPIEQVSQQPDFHVPSTEHLVRYKEGDLLGFLLRLDEEQLKYTRWALSGPTMVSGGAGTGKSTVALYRVKEVLERPGATGREQVLFTTYTRALLAVTHQLLEQLLTPDQLKRVRVATCDEIAREIVASRRTIHKFEDDRESRQQVRELLRSHDLHSVSTFEAGLRARALARLNEQYVLEEFDWIIVGRGLRSLEEYLETPRPGRGIAFPPRLRTAIWELCQTFRKNLSGERFPELRNEALEIVRSGGWRGQWDYVFVDEAQDLSPTTLGLMAEVCKGAEGLFFVSDPKQSLYSRSYTWTSAHPRLQFRGRTAKLKRNYRSTKEIDRAAFSVLVPQEGEVLEPSLCVYEGPLPVLVHGADPEQEIDWTQRFVTQMAHHLHLRQNAAVVLVPTEKIGKSVAEKLTAAGLPATFFAGRELDLKADCIKVLTLYSAKGLEFPIVVVCGFQEGSYPVAQNFDDPDLFDERMRHERRLLYVALTRAMRGLMLIVPKDCQHLALVGLDASNWSVEEIG